MVNDEAHQGTGDREGVGQAVSGWRQEATRAGLAAGQIDRMASAFEHDDLRTALDL